MPRPQPGWLDRLPRERCLAEASLWSADLLNLGADLDRLAGTVDLLHVDVADGRFAPSFLFFPDLVAAVRAATSLPIHVHLMVAGDALPAQVDLFAEAGADLLTVHAEAGCTDAALGRIRAHGVAAGLALRVGTPVAEAAPWLGRVDALTLLGTAIGVKGQGLDPRAEARLREARAWVAHAGRRVLLAADGGIREATVPRLRAAGADTVVLGSLAFAAPDLGARIAWLRAL